VRNPVVEGWPTTRPLCFPPTTIDDKTVNVVQGIGEGGSRFKLYFSQETGLLTRQVRYADTPIGMVPTQVDYTDYREVAGVKLPYHIVITLDRRSIRHPVDRYSGKRSTRCGEIRETGTRCPENAG
jgi:hypothetical protein